MEVSTLTLVHISLAAIQYPIQLYSSVVRALAHGAMGNWIDPSWWTH